MRTRTRMSILPAMVLAMLALVAGCEQEEITLSGGGIPPNAPRRMRLDEAASRLRLQVAHRSRTSATLRDTINTVVLYCDPLGEVYLNGRALADSGGIEAAGDTFLVPVPLVSRICARLVPADLPVTVAPSLPAPPPPPIERECAIGKAVLDPGHGGKDPGATSTMGSHEKNIVLTVSKLAALALEARGAEVRLTRSNDRFLELEDRPAVANRWKADAFVSLHADAAPNRSASGFTVYVSRSADRASLALAKALVRRLAATGASSRGIRRADFRVLVHSARPAALVELGYLSNRYEAARLGKRSCQQRLASAVAGGIADFMQGK